MKSPENTAVVSGSTRIHEKSYQLLMRLLASRELNSAMGLTAFINNIQLNIKIIECTRYTTTLELSNCMGKNGHLLPELSMRVRAYHDASVAEVVAYQGLFDIPPPYLVRTSGPYQKNEKRHINQLMYDLLHLCHKGEGKSVRSNATDI